MERVLVSNVNWLGDSLLMTPLLRALKEKGGVSYLALFTHRRTKEIFLRNPFVDEIIDFEEEDLRRPGRFLSLSVRLAQRELDTAIMLKSSSRRLFMFKLARIKQITGFKGKKRVDFFLDVKVKADPFSMHRMHYYLKLLEAEGIYAEAPRPDFFVGREDAEKARSFLHQAAGGRKTVILHPGANWSLKRWPENYFSSLNDLLQEKLGVFVLISGSEGDISLAERISASCRYKPFIACGRFSLGEMAAVIKESNLFVSADTGIMHLAAAVNAPLIALFGPTSPAITSPFSPGAKIFQKDVGCEIPCYNLECSDNICMKEIKPQEVFCAAEKIINRHAD